MRRLGRMTIVLRWPTAGNFDPSGKYHQKICVPHHAPFRTFSTLETPAHDWNRTAIASSKQNTVQVSNVRALFDRSGTFDHSATGFQQKFGWTNNREETRPYHQHRGTIILLLPACSPWSNTHEIDSGAREETNNPVASQTYAISCYFRIACRYRD